MNGIVGKHLTYRGLFVVKALAIVYRHREHAPACVQEDAFRWAPLAKRKLRDCCSAASSSASRSSELHVEHGREAPRREQLRQHERRELDDAAVGVER
jgi:hypothetical protein